MKFLRILPKISRALYKSIHDAILHDGIEHAGYISFLAMLSLFPFYVLFMALIGIIGQEKLGYFLIDLLLQSSWSHFIDALKPRIMAIATTPPQSLITLALLSAIWTASSIFEGLRTILNRAYRVTNPPPYLLRRLISIMECFIALAVCVLLVFLLVLLPWLWKLLETWLPLENLDYLALLLSPQAETGRTLFGNTFMFLLVWYLYYGLANLKCITWHSALPGTILCLLSWTLFGKIFSYYLWNFPQMNFIYGSIAGVIVALLYFYFMSLLFIISAEFNYHMGIARKY